MTPAAPTVTVTPSASTITTVQPLSVTVAVAASQGGATPTGSILLTSGTYTSSPATLSNGSATISVPAGSLPAGTDSLKATYTPDTASSVAYKTSSGTGSVTVSCGVTVASTNPASGVSITVSPKDVNGNGSGSTPISLAYGPSTTVTLTAPATTTGATFNSWTGCSSTSGTPALTCTLNVTTAATVTANYASVSVSPTGNVTIGQSQQFIAAVTGLTPGTVTWSVAVASGIGSAGTIASTGLYQTPYPAPTSVTITATSTANTAIKGTATITLAAPTTAAGSSPVNRRGNGDTSHQSAHLRRERLPA